jgi:DNA-binding transcriptional LysR family regulator
MSSQYIFQNTNDKLGEYACTLQESRIISPMNELDTIRIFLKVAELESFSGAARQLGLPNATVSAGVRQLEAALGTRSRDLLGDFDDLRTMFRRTADGLEGRLRVDMSVGLAARFVLPRLGEFMARHPRLAIDLGTADRRVDVIREGYDCVLRSGTLADSSLVARPLGSYRMVNCASPAYLAQRGVPRTLDDLAHHVVIHYDAHLGGTPPVWEWFDGSRTHTAPAGSMLTVNGTAAYSAACCAGLGIIQVPEAGVRDQLQSGALVAVLPDFCAAPMPLFFVYPSRRNVPARTLTFMDWVQDLMAPYLERDR